MHRVYRVTQKKRGLIYIYKAAYLGQKLIFLKASKNSAVLFVFDEFKNVIQYLVTLI